jgi:hypothetical protein
MLSMSPIHQMQIIVCLHLTVMLMVCCPQAMKDAMTLHTYHVRQPSTSATMPEHLESSMSTVTNLDFHDHSDAGILVCVSTFNSHQNKLYVLTAVVVPSSFWITCT